MDKPWITDFRESICHSVIGALIGKYPELDRRIGERLLFLEIDTSDEEGQFFADVRLTESEIYAAAERRLAPILDRMARRRPDSRLGIVIHTTVSPEDRQRLLAASWNTSVRGVPVVAIADYIEGGLRLFGAGANGLEVDFLDEDYTNWDQLRTWLIQTV